MKNKDVKNGPAENKNPESQDNIEEIRDKAFPGYPAYPASEDIMNKEDREELDVEKVTSSARINNEIAREEGEDPADYDEGLDVPGAELDDDVESVGEEDEENNYYSLGGDRHEDLDEINEDDI